ncbi:peptide deformylase [Capnocytophaga catalasegens]|uniref:Peptide deformylase n=1 Tax=Capnocytophaga catalasegens TaxID=1004260 RepID=A0AAV5AY15_9FLAO|nr:peptide deformylase [Capnocytophaga catalasegens]GIZ15127.1 peptide deformylase [Capnocytophaga catalasegens]GJM49642.1 peptide deformylase [Capnocytophaga catalasegens]GJM52707.1 peptide deformylase [Capnocytophaga catalasegens]
MVLPIVAYGDPVLRKVCEPIQKDYPKLKELIANMFDTMYSSSGVGLAAPQIGKPIRLFVIDTEPFSQDEDLLETEKEFLSNFKKVFINARIIEEKGDEWTFNEGCLSIPGVNEDVKRKGTIVVEYQDEQFNLHQQTFSGLAARVIQHEYDHIEGILFTDKLSSFKKQLLKGKLTNISKGKVSVRYRMHFPDQKKR